ncbi:ABC transporter substrate-binding protein [Raoultella terrigena]|uniref:ABC transporter substrate-binding protein n=1 Tax=Raoultella terrigena TaxID=577 RepID=UPI0009FAC2C8|nr:ABC transporter substrate-binding protein [Raoultella terrigena]
MFINTIKKHYLAKVLLGTFTLMLGFSGSLYAEEKLPSVIHIAGQGNPYGTPYGSAVIGVVRAGHYLEDEFAKDNVKIDWQFPQGTGPAINEALANGQLDFANYGGLPNIVGRGSGLGTTVLASYGSSPIYVVVRKDSPIKSLQDLKGKKVSVSRGTILELSLATLLSEQGLTENDIQLFDLKSADQISALTSGDIDVIVGTSDVLTLLDKGIATQIYTTKGKSDPANIFGSLVVTNTFLKQYPQATQRVVDAFVKAAAFVADEKNRPQVFAWWALTKVPPNSLETDYKGDLLKERLSPLLDDYYLANLRRGIAFAKQSKLIRRDIDVSTWVDPSYLNRAVEKYGYSSLWTKKAANGEPDVQSQ